MRACISNQSHGFNITMPRRDSKEFQTALNRAVSLHQIGSSVYTKLYTC